MLRRLLARFRRKAPPPASQRAAKKVLALGMRDTTALVRRRLG